MKTLASLMALIALAIAFVLISSDALPLQVATHFNRSGMPDGFMSQATYRRFMAVLVAAVPALMTLSALLTRHLPRRLINLPHRDYWLAPERQAETMAWLVSRTLAYAHVVVLFLCHVHWLVVEANAHTPPRLAAAPLFAGLAVLVVFTLVWVWRYRVRFRRPA